MKNYSKILITIISTLIVICFITIITLMMILPKYATSKEVTKIKEKSIKIAKDYIEEKYGEAFNEGEIIIGKNPEGFCFATLNDKVLLYNDTKEYSVFIDLKNDIIADDKQISDIKEDIKKEFLEDIEKDNTITEFSVYGISDMSEINCKDVSEHFTKEMIYNNDIKSFLNEHNIGIKLNIHIKASEIKENTRLEQIVAYESKLYKSITNLTEHFKRDNSEIHFALYNPDKYMCEEVKYVLNKRGKSINDRYIYGSDYTYLNIIANKSCKYNSKTDKIESLPWNIISKYDQFIEIDKGLYASSCFNKKFMDRGDVLYIKYPTYEIVDNVTVLDKETLSPVIDTDLNNKVYTNKNNETLLSDIFSIGYNFVVEDDDKYIDIMIDKKAFENGLLLNENNFIGEIYIETDDLSTEEFSMIPLSKGFYREDNDYIYMTIDKDTLLAIYHKE